MKILLSPKIFVELSVIENVVNKREFSGYGFVNVEKNEEDTIFNVYDYVLLDVGSTGYTEFDSKKILKVMERPDSKNMKLWFHRHPLGNGTPGPHNWSGTDENTCVNEPLGCPDPDAVKWALAMVLTPKGWVGRIDQFKSGKAKTRHIPVVVDINWSIMDQAKELLKEQQAKEKTQKTPTNYTDLLDNHDPLDDDSFEAAHPAIDEAEEILNMAEFQLDSGLFEDAIDGVAWAHDIAFYYRNNMYVKDRARELMQEVQRVMKKLKKVRKNDRT
jgi:hypothetical protein